MDTTLKAPRPGSPADIVLTVDGKEVARTLAKMTVPAAFTASETFDVGVDLGSPVSRDYFERRPFKFDGKIETGEGRAEVATSGSISKPSFACKNISSKEPQADMNRYEKISAISIC